MTGYLTESKLIAAPPALIATLDVTLRTYLEGLPAPDFKIAADTETQWAVKAAAPDENGAGGTAWVVSAESYRRIRSHRF